MTVSTLLGALVTAGVLGLTHGIEPDHVAGIASLAGETADSRLSAVVGACFSLGHVALVVAWLGVLAVLNGRGALPTGLDAFGTAGAALLLAGIGAFTAVGGLRAVIRPDEHSHGDVTHGHLHVHLPRFGRTDHDHVVRSYLETGLLGALFTLSPPLSMLAFAGTLFPQYGISAVTLAVVVYTLSITLTMSAVGAGVGTAFGRVRELDARAYGAVRVVAGVAAASLAVVMFGSAGPVV